jgi:Fe-S cluster assembly protein SufD
LAEATKVAVSAPAGAYTREAVEARSRAEPAWLRERRLEAWEQWEALPLPTTRLEEWRYTDPKLLGWDKVGLPGADAERPPAALEQQLESRERSGSVLQWGATGIAIALDEAVARKGVILSDLSRAADEHADLVRDHLGTRVVAPGNGKFAALNGALWSGGVFIYIPRGVRLEAPIRIVRWIDEAGAAYLPRTLIVAEDGCHAGVVEEFVSPDFDKPVFVNAGVEIHASPAADVQYVAFQKWGRGVRHLSTQRTVAQRDANLDSLVVNLGANVARVELAASLEGPGARSDMLGLYFGRADQHFDHETRQDHRVPHATSDLLYKGALTDRSNAVFRGMIKVFPKAQRTDAYQTNRNLLLSSQAQSTSLPNLEIEADDVRCSHAATVGHLDEEELFYIMSRGIPRHVAERLVVFGFFGEVLDRLPMPSVVRELRAAIEERIG